MEAAIASHNSYAKFAVEGLGVDRHMQGLKMACLEKGIEPHPIFSDLGYIRYWCIACFRHLKKYKSLCVLIKSGIQYFQVL